MRTLSSVHSYNGVMESLQDHWLEVAKPGRKVKIIIKDELADAE